MGKLLNYAGAKFDPIIMRWIYGNTDVYQKKSEVFQEGYEDPTYMTFRIEFGEWGSSVLSKEHFAMHNGVILNTLHQDYDQLPNGLLDLHFAGDEIRSYRNYSFNNQTYYNAYNYLLHRNEDTRAEYIKAFVTGLYEIQREHPYLFQSISGLDGLSAFNPASGFRIQNDTFISIECIEGLSLKIKTLLELYRKAAWDDIWQRWILPENMRQFKMIIYVFERRTFHTSDGNKIGVAQFNDDIPVYAYECNPCEFVIENHWGSDYDAHFGNDVENTKITVRVKNATTYYRNGLLQGYLSDLMIYDLFDHIDRTKGSENSYTLDNYFSRNLTPKEAKSVFLHKKVILENEDFTPSGAIQSRIFYGNGDNLPLNDIEANGYIAAINNSMMRSNSLLGERLAANWWHEATVEGRDYWSSMSGWNGLFSGSTWRNIGKGLWGIITAATTQIRVSQNYSTHNSTVFYNILDYIDIEGSMAAEAFSPATQLGMNMPKDLVYEREDVTRGEFSWATRDLKDRKFGDQHVVLTEIDSKALTENDYSWATDDPNAEGNHDWERGGRREGRQKHPFNWVGIDSSTMTGGDFSWATTDYTETGTVKGNDWDNAAQYNSAQVPRQKNGFVWNSIDSEAMVGGDHSWATNDPNDPNDHNWQDFNADKVNGSQRQKHPFNWVSINSKELSDNITSSATKDDRELRKTYDRDFLTDYDFSWATVDKDSETEHKQNVNMDRTLDSSRGYSPLKDTGYLPADQQTNFDFSWATADDDNIYDHHVRIINGKIDASNRKINDEIQMAIDDARELPDYELLDVSGNRKPNTEIQMAIEDSSRPYDMEVKTPFDDARKINDNVQIEIDPDREMPEYNMAYVDRDVNYRPMNVISPDYEDREQNKDVPYVPLDPRDIKDPQFTDIENERELKKQNYPQITEKVRPVPGIQTDIDPERNIPDPLFGEMDEERYFYNQMQEVDYNIRPISMSHIAVEDNPRQIKDNVQLEMEGERSIKHDVTSVFLEERKIVDQALLQPDNFAAGRTTSLQSLDTTERVVNDKSYFSLQNTERYIDNTIQIEHFTPRTLADDVLAVMDNKERPIENIKMNRLDLIEVVSKATSEFNKVFKEIDTESSRIDATAKEMIDNSESFKSLQYKEEFEKDNNLDTAAFLKAYSDATDSMKAAFAKRIEKLKKELKKYTISAIRSIPEMEYQQVDFENRETIDPILVSVDEYRQIKDNIKLISLADAEIRDLSYKGLISLHSEYEKQIVKTMIMEQTEQAKDRSLATDLDEPPKPIINGEVDQTERKPEKNISADKIDRDYDRHPNSNIQAGKILNEKKTKHPLLGHSIERPKNKKKE